MAVNGEIEFLLTPIIVPSAPQNLYIEVKNDGDDRGDIKVFWYVSYDDRPYRREWAEVKTLSVKEIKDFGHRLKEPLDGVARIKLVVESLNPQTQVWSVTDEEEFSITNENYRSR